MPLGFVVEASNNPTPSLTRPATVNGSRAHDAPRAIADIERQNYPFASVDAQRKGIAELDVAGYGVVFQRDGYVVLYRL